MSHPEEDQDLVSFLRRNRPQPPPAAPNLEFQILQALPPRRPFRPWIGAGVIAAGLLGAVISYRLIDSTPDRAAIEAFMESTWSTTVNGTQDLTQSTASSDYLAMLDSTQSLGE